MSDEHFFPYAYDDRFKLFLVAVRPRRDRDGVTVDDERFVATFGRYRLETHRHNVLGGHVTRDYRWWTAIGLRLSLADDGLTFGTNARAGVCVHFAEPVHHVMGRKDHSALTVTVADPEGLVRVIGEAEPR